MQPASQTSTDLPPQDNIPDHWIPAHPGFRTRPGRSGLDYIDTQIEFSRQQGLFIRKVFTGRLFTRDPFHLFLMLLFGLIGAGLLVVILLGFRVSMYTGIFLAIFLGLYAATGIALLINFSRNIQRIRSGASTDEAPFRPPRPTRTRRAAAVYISYQARGRRGRRK